VAGGKLYTMGHEGGKDTVWCLDALTGKVVWKHAYEAELGDNLFEGGPTATPTVHAGSVYTFSRWGDLFCFDAADGKVRWQRNVAKDLEMPVPGWGFASSPVVHDKLVLLTVGQAGLALDKDSGKTAWSSAKEEAGYSTPLLFRQGNDTFAIVSSGNAYMAVNAATGKGLWEVPWITRYGINAAQPILAGDQLFLSTGYGKGCALFQTGDEPKEVWRSKNLRNQINSSVLVDGFLYGIDGDTTTAQSFKCLEWKTGQVRWTHDGIGMGALMAADGKLIVLSDQGELLIAPASPEGFKPTARAKILQGKCWTVPVLANGRIYCRSAAGEVVCLDVRKR
jgi:outer membrane protein assembly factor BamB